jgi:hypothetical protein
MPDVRAMNALGPAVVEGARRLYEHVRSHHPEVPWLGGPTVSAADAVRGRTVDELRAALDGLDPAALCERGVELGRALDEALIHYQTATLRVSGWRD